MQAVLDHKIDICASSFAYKVNAYKEGNAVSVYQQSWRFELVLSF